MVDFSIEPAFQEKLDWMKDFVTNKVRPLEFIYDYDKDAAYDVENKPLRKIIRRLQQEVKDNGMWAAHLPDHLGGRSEEHTSELQSLMRSSYAVFCLKKKKK